MKRIFACAVVLSLLGCGDDGTPPVEDGGMVDSGGRDASMDTPADTGEGDVGDRDTVGTDVAVDSMPGDALDGGDVVDGGPTAGSMITVMAPGGGVVTVAAVDAAGAPLTLDTLAVFSDGATVAVIASVGSTGYLFNLATMVFDEFGPLVDTESNPVDPDILFTGNIGDAERLGAVVATDVRLFDGAGMVFEDALPLTSKIDPDAEAMPFAPQSLTFGTFNGNQVIVALSTTDTGLYLFDGSSFLRGFVSLLGCDGSTITPSLVASRAISAAENDTFMFVSGSNMHPGEFRDASFCLGTPTELRDQAGDLFEPIHAVGVDGDGDGNDDLVFLH